LSLDSNNNQQPSSNAAQPSFSKEGKVLVTGGTGFLGSYIIKELVKKGYPVRAIRRTNKLPFWIEESILNKVEWVDGDVLDVISLQDAMEGVRMVIHAAAIVSFHKKDRQQIYQVNVEGTANVVNMALEAGVKKMVHISSVAALGRTVNGLQVNEEKKWEESKTNTHYAISKFKAELHVWRGMAEGLDAVILNPSTILGYGDWHSSSCAIFKQVHDGFKWYTNGINGFVAVEDVAKATILLLDSKITEQRYIVNGANWPFKQLQETIAHGFNKKPPTKLATSFLLNLAWRIEKLKSIFTGKKPLLTKESAKVAQSQTYFNNEKLLAALPDFSFTPLEKAIENACKKYIGIINDMQP
jgi:nucleoside-diphosphate-sugar epimerase